VLAVVELLVFWWFKVRHLLERGGNLAPTVPSSAQPKESQGWRIGAEGGSWLSKSSQSSPVHEDAETLRSGWEPLSLSLPRLPAQGASFLPEELFAVLLPSSGDAGVV
jgi:hypothetical protein